MPGPAAASAGAEAALPIDDAARARGRTFIALAVGAAGFAMAFQMGLNSNFVVDVIDISGRQQGMLESARETCGITALVVLALLAGLAEPLVGAAVLALFGVGLGCYYRVNSYTWLVLTSLVWSQGLHVWMPLPNSMTLSLAEPGRSGFRLGRTQSAGAAGFAAGLAAAMILTAAGVAIRGQYVVAGAMGVLAGAMCLGVPRNIKTPGPRLVVRRRYSLYYALCLLDGWRKQIFMCFAGFLLVRKHNTPLWTMLLLWSAVQVIGYFSAPRVGRLIDRVGERKVLVAYFCCVAVFFAGYATIPNTYVLYGVFVADNAVFVLTMALNTYANGIAPKSELTPTLSMGVAMNHVGAVIMPLVGGLLWQSLGYRWPFIAGLVVAVLSVPVALRVPRRAAAGAAERVAAAG